MGLKATINENQKVIRTLQEVKEIPSYQAILADKVNVTTRTIRRAVKNEECVSLGTYSKIVLAAAELVKSEKEKINNIVNNIEG